MTWREYEQKFGTALDEDVKIGVFLALTPPSVQNHCHSNSHILKSNTHVSTMLFDCCRAQADVAASENMPMDLSMLGKGKRAKTTSKAKGGDGKDDKKEEGENGNRQRQRQRDRVLRRLLPSDAKLVTHEEGLLVERPSPPSHQEQEGHSISGNREHGRQSTGVHDDWNAVTIRRQQHSGRPHEMDVLFDSGAATSRCQQCFSDSLGGKPNGAGVDLRSATIHHYG